MKKPVPSHPIDATVQRRLDALERLIDSEYDGKASVFEAHTAIKMAQVNQWFSGYRALRDKALRRLETVTKKPEGWFDGNTANAAITAPSPSVSATSGPGGTSQDKTDVEQTLQATVGLMAAAIDQSSAKGSEVLSGALLSLAKDPQNPLYQRILLDLLATKSPPAGPIGHQDKPSFLKT